jgi:hypothetical protein
MGTIHKTKMTVSRLLSSRKAGKARLKEVVLDDSLLPHIKYVPAKTFYGQAAVVYAGCLQRRYMMRGIGIFYIIMIFILVSACGSGRVEDEKLYPLIVDGKWGYIDKSGKLVIKSEFDDAYAFSEGLAMVKAGSKYGYIDSTGRYVIKPEFDEAHFFSEGLAMVKAGSKYGYIDKNGKYVIKPEFDAGFGFKEDVAAVETGNKLKELLNATPDELRLMTSAGANILGKWGYIDKTGKYVIKPEFDFATEFSEGMAQVQNGGKFGYIDKTMQYVIQPEFEVARVFSEGLAAVKSGDKWGYIDRTGKYVIKPEFDFATEFSEGLA